MSELGVSPLASLADMIRLDDVARRLEDGLAALDVALARLRAVRDELCAVSDSREVDDA